MTYKGTERGYSSLLHRHGDANIKRAVSCEHIKQRFIIALGVALKTTSTVVYSKADADLDIVLAAIDCAKTKATAVVGEDTDLADFAGTPLMS